MRHIQRRVAAGTLVLTVLAVSGCAANTDLPANAYTARVVLGSEKLPTIYSVHCTQTNWFWTIETEPKAPGFTAIVQTGADVKPKVVRIRDMTGFTGSSPEASGMQASIEGTTFRISGTAHGSFADRPTKPAEMQYRVEAHC